jgi:hypothetical protein
MDLDERNSPPKGGIVLVLGTFARNAVHQNAVRRVYKKRVKYNTNSGTG